MNTAIAEASEIIAHPDVLVSPQAYRRLLARLVSECAAAYEAGVKFGLAQREEK